MKKKLRLNWLINSLVVILIVGGALLCLHFSRTVPWEKCSEVYKKYSRVEGVRATYIKDFRINDTLTVGVTLLEATDSAGWATLQEDFGLPVVPKGYEESFVSDSNRVSMKFFSKEVPLIDGEDTLAHDLMVISHYKHSIAYIELQSIKQKMSLIHIFINDNMILKSYEQVN